MRKIIAWVLIGLCIAATLYCAAVMIYRLATFTAAKRFGAVARFLAEFGFACLFLLPALDLRFGIFRWTKTKVVRILGIALRWVTVAICTLIVALCLAIVITGTITNPAPVQNVCVLGLSIASDDLPQDLVYRLNTAIDYQKENPENLFIVTGGNSEDPAYSEAAQMARYLQEHGFNTDPNKLIAETNAKTTVENFEYTAAFVNKQEPLGVITNNHHIFRASKIAKKQGYTHIVNLPAPSVPLLYPENIFWETICSVFETLAGDMKY